jgi:FKBP-type peptidyl-prolyl cis-trans isomerase
LVGYDGYYCDAEAPDLKGERFESTEGGALYQFILGAGAVIEGWDEGILGMKEGGIRRITIPPDMAYGENGWQEIPPNATLIFEVDLVEVQ